MAAMQQQSRRGTSNGAGGTLEHTGHCASQSRARGTISLTDMLRQQPPLDVEVHAPRPLLAPPLPPSNTLSSRFQRHTSPPLSPSLFRSLPPSPLATRVLLSPYAVSLLQPQVTNPNRSLALSLSRSLALSLSRSRYLIYWFHLVA